MDSNAFQLISSSLTRIEGKVDNANSSIAALGATVNAMDDRVDEHIAEDRCVLSEQNRKIELNTKFRENVRTHIGMLALVFSGVGAVAMVFVKELIGSWFNS